MRHARRRIVPPLASAAALALGAGPAYSQGGADAQPDNGAPGDGASGAQDAIAPPSRWTLSLDVTGGYIFGADMDSGPGELAVAFAGARASAAYAIDKTSRVTLSIGGEYWNYDFDGVTGLIVGTSSPFEDLYVGSLGALYTKRIDEHWGIVLGANIQSAGEGGSDFSDTLTYAGIAGFRYAFDESFSLGLSLYVSSRLEDDVIVIPIPIIEWQIDEKWRLASETQIDSVLYVLSYQATDHWNLGLGAGFYSQRFRLDENGPVPSGLADVQRVLVAGRAVYEPNSNIEVALTGGYVVFHDIELLTAGGGHISSDEVKPSPYLGVSVGFTF